MKVGDEGGAGGAAPTASIVSASSAPERLTSIPPWRIADITVKIAFIAAISFAGCSPVASEPFNPVRDPLTWSTDRRPVDIEVVGSSSMLPELHRLEPDRVLRFRLERAYVQHFTARRSPGFEVVHFGIDIETLLPNSLFLASIRVGRFHEQHPGIPKLSLEELSRRSLLIVFKSDSAAVRLKRGSDELVACKGPAQEGQLFSYVWEGRRGCDRPMYPNGSLHIAQYREGLLLRIECQDESFQGLGCMLRFPFDGFRVELNFDRSHLANWLFLIDRAVTFLESKKYR
jgi:hypothetical protein